MLARYYFEFGYSHNHFSACFEERFFLILYLLKEVVRKNKQVVRFLFSVLLN